MKSITLFLAVLIYGAHFCSAQVSGLKATCRNGQVFLTWKEASTPEGTTFNIYVSNKPIKDVAKARLASHHIEQHSARDWWEDPASFTKGAEHNAPVGFIIEKGGKRIDPQSGLFVYTLKKKDTGKIYFAITTNDSKGIENKSIVSGMNTSSEGIKAIAGKVQPIWQHEEPEPERGSGKDKALSLNLHGKGGLINNMEYLVFGDENLGWRAGLPFKFSVRIQGDVVLIRPNDRVWINRPHDEAGDGGMPAIWTFWYGYNTNIWNRELMEKGVPTNYTERLLMKILGFVDEYYQTDKNRWYCSGSSMGGCGTISFGMRHPELFAALHAHVPIVSFNYNTGNTGKRFEPACWVGKIPDDLLTNEGAPFLERMDGLRYLRNNKADLPWLFIVNGRKDTSIPWQNNPPFYKLLAEKQQGHAIWFDNGVHSTSGTQAPEDVKAWDEFMLKFKKNESFPVFTNTSTDGNYGNGDPLDGDTVGWVNRGMDWKNIEDQPDHYAITISANYPGIKYPVKTDVRLRRVQQFKPGANSEVEVSTGNDVKKVKTLPDGGVLIKDIVIAGKEGVRIVIK